MTFYTRAASIGRTALGRVSVRGTIGVVHSVFSTAINILTTDDHLISVVDRGVGRGPINVVVDLPNRGWMSSLGLEQGDAVWSEEAALLVPDRIVISTQGAPVYRPARSFGDALLPSSRIENNLTVMSQCVRARGRSAVAEYLTSHLLDEHPGRPEPSGHPRLISTRGRSSIESQLRSFTSLALRRLSDFLATVEERNYAAVRVCASNLVGLGPGLTPSCDDILAGFLLSLRSAEENRFITGDDLIRVIEEVTSSVPTRTTLISEEFLLHAAVGEANEPVMRVLQTVLTAGPGEVLRATSELLEVGDSSGTEIALGVWLGLRLALGRRIAFSVAA